MNSQASLFPDSFRFLTLIEEDGHKLSPNFRIVSVGLASVAQAQLSNFKHVVIIVQENRTPDNLFQGLCAPPYGACAVPPTSLAPYDIQTSNWLTKNGTINPTPVALASAYGLGHSHDSFNLMCDMVAGNPPMCRMDGASGIPCGSRTARLALPTRSSVM